MAATQPAPPIASLTPVHELSLLAGASGAGKSTLLLQAVRCIQRGEPFFGLPTNPDLRIGYIAADRRWSSYEQTATRIGVDPDKLTVISIVDDPSINLSALNDQPMRVLSAVLERLKPDAEFIIVDPLILFLGCDVRSYNQVAVRLIQINRWAASNRRTLLGTHHAAKARSDYSYKRPQDRISGSAALLGYSSTQVFLEMPEESDLDYFRLTIVSHTDPAVSLQLVRDDTSGGFVRYDLRHDEETQQVLDALPLDGTLDRSALLRQLQLGPVQLDQKLAMLLDLRLAEQVSHHRYRRLRAH